MKHGVNRITVALIVALTLTFASLGVTPANAQVSTGSVSGNLVDAQGAGVPSASVQLTNKDSNQVFTSQSDNAGLFHLAQLQPGTYRVEISKQGFKKVVFDTIEVAVGADRGLGAIKLEIGEVTATVEVSSAPPLVENTEAQVTNEFTSTNIQTFPGVLENQGLDFLALTVPGVASNRDLGFSNSNGPGFEVNGIRGRNNDQQIDGQNNNDNSVAGPAVYVSDPEFVQEYQITTNNFSAEYGRNSGSVVNIITKSGTNQLHGSVYGTESNSVAALQKYGPYAITAGNPAPQGTAVTKYFDNAPVNNTVDPSTNVAACGYELNGIQRTLPTGSRSYNFPIKLDLQTAKNHFYGRYVYNKTTFFNLDNATTAAAAQGYSYDNPGLGQDYGFSWVRT